MSSIGDKLKQMQAALDGQIDSAPCFIASDDVHEYEILKNRPGTPKIAIGWSKSVARVNFPGGDITGRQNQFYYATISRGRGLNQTRSDNVIYGSGGGKPLYELGEILEDFCRAIRFDPVTDEQPDYISTENIDVKFYGVDGVKVKIWVGTQKALFNPLQLQTEPE